MPRSPEGTISPVWPNFDSQIREREGIIKKKNMSGASMSLLTAEAYNKLSLKKKSTETGIEVFEGSIV